MPRPWRPYSVQTRQTIDGKARKILLSDDVLEPLMNSGHQIGWVPGDFYPWVVLDDHSLRPVQRLHEYVAAFAASLGLRDPIPEGMDIHHRNSRKEDARIENLAVVSHADHAKLHRAEKRSRQKAHRGLWRKEYDKPLPPTSYASAIVSVLHELLPELSDELWCLDSGEPLARAQGCFTDKRSKQLGLWGWVRLGLRDHEAALIGLFVRHKSARSRVPKTGEVFEDRIADAIIEALERRPGSFIPDRGFVTAWIDRTIKLTAVNQALHRWWEHRRLPPQLMADHR